MKNLLLIALMIPALLFAEESLNGENIFKSNCSACHKIDKKLVGPPLKNITEKREEDWLLSFIKNSQSLINGGDKAAKEIYSEYNELLMPPQNLSDAEIQSVLDFITTESKNTKAEVNPIQRPKEIAYTPSMLHFGTYWFWIPYTVVVILLVGTLYLMVYVTELGKNY